MIHEPECIAITDEEPGVRTGACIFCGIARAGFQRGMAEAERIARGRHIDMMYCSKPDECHTIARGAYLAAEDIRWEIDRPARIARGDGSR